MEYHKVRIGALDWVRGVALLGILLINLQVFSTTFFLFEKWFATHAGKSDGIIFRSIVLLVTQRFIGIFSLLFGVGVAIQQENFKQRSEAFTPYYLRRTFLLAVFGAINLVFFFWGDILLIYSVFSLLLLIFFKQSNRVILVTAAVIFIVPSILYAIEPIRLFFEMPRFRMLQHASAERFIEIYQSGSVFEMAKSRVLDYYYSYLPDLTWHRTSFACMLIGYYLGRNNYHQRYVYYLKQLKWHFWIALIFCIGYVAADAGLRDMLAPTPFNILLNNLFIGVSIFVYLLLLLYYFERRSGKGLVIRLFTNIGKMSLSNYFFQQIACAFIFHSYGLGLYFTTCPTVNFILTLCLFSLQLILSSLYLKVFKIGPLELLWRKFSYTTTTF